MNEKNRTILHIITSTGVGGAEMALYQYLAYDRDGPFSHQVLSLAPLGAVGDKMQKLGLPVHALDLSAGLGGMFAFPRLYAFIKKINPGLVHCWMYHANLLGGLAARLARVPLVWGIHHHDLNPALLKRGTILVARLGARLSGWLPQKIIYCAQSAMREHERIGYASDRGIFIPNGIDTQRFAPNPELRQQARARLGISPDALVVGHAGRFDPTKGHHHLLRAARLVLDARPRVQFALCGREVDADNLVLRAWLAELGIAQAVRLLGPLEDMLAFYNMLDVLVSSSLSEAFGMVIGEALSCAVPCVATDVGDSALLVGEGGLAVPAGDARAMADALLTLLGNEKQRVRMGAIGRAHIQENFSMGGMLRKMNSMYRGVFEAQ